MVKTEVVVADYIAQFLLSKNIKHVFGYQGGAVTKIIDSIVATKKIGYVQNYHEQASSFCADAYSRVTQNIGVAIATSGPGATNLITGIANAQLDSIATFFITGQDYKANVTRENSARLNGFQDLDIASVVKPITKYANMLTDKDKIRYELEKCYHLATNGRPGAVLLDIPIDLQFSTVVVEELEPYIPEPSTEYEFDKAQEVIRLLKESKRPVILAGGGVQISKCSQELKKFSEKSNIPVVSTLNGLDAVEGGYSFAGLHGNVYSNIIIKNADLIIAFGSRFGQRQVGKVAEKYTSAKIIHIDIDEVELNRGIKADLAILAPIQDFLVELNKSLNNEELPSFNAWVSQADQWKKKYIDTCELNKEKVKPVALSKEIIKALPEESIICSDVGQNQMWVAQAFEKRGEMRLLNSSGLGSMGYSLPAAIGAKYAHPEATVLSCTGDGGLMMNMQELLLIGQRQLNIKVIVYNNNTLGMMREVQERYYDSHFYGANPQEFACVGLAKTADTFGLEYVKIKDNSEFCKLKPFLESNKPCIIELEIDIDSKLSNRYDEESIIQENMLND